MSTDDESGLGSLGFFSGVPVDDKKYETLLEDLRAHDLLGPVDDGFDSVGYGGRTSLLLNDSLSAIFSGNLPKDKPAGPPSQPVSAPKVAKAPPPGFAATPAGSAPTQADLEWARSQQEFALLRNEFAKKVPGGAVGLTSAGLGLSKPFLYSEDDDGDDDAILENINMKTFGLDEDDDFRARAASPTPESLPVPKLPSPPPGMPSAPPGLPSPPPGMPSHAPIPPQPVMMQPPPPGMGYPPANMPPQPFPHHPGGPPHPHMMPPHPMMMYPPPPQIPQFNGPPPHVIMNEKIFKIMNPRDVQFVVQQQLKQIRSSDPFSDDYYFHNYHVKRERARANPAAPSPVLPLPSWKLEHVKSFDPRDVSRANKSREWESENQVLGRTAKSSLYRPRELLNLADDTEPVLTRSKTPSNSVFFNDTWSKRQRIDEGMGYLLALQDARHILDARRINVQQFHQMDPQQMDPALVELRDKTANLLLELAKVLGVSATGECDKAVLWSILSVSKGKKLVCRALPLLHPSARFLIFPLLVQYMLAQTLTNEDQKSEETIADEDRLAQTLVVALLYQQPSPPPQALADSLQFALEGQSIPTLSLVLHNRTRAELLQALLQKGGTVCANTVDEVKAKWLKYQDLFVELASRIKESSQQHGGL